MDRTWRDETKRVSVSFEAIADLYAQQFGDELNDKPFDRDLLEAFASRLDKSRPVVEVGAGPAHVGAALASHGVAVIASDVAMGQMEQARARGTRLPLVVADLARLPVGPQRVGGILAFYCLIYGSAEHLDTVFADWHRVLPKGASVLLAFHVGEGSLHVDDWGGRRVDMTVVLRDLSDVERRLVAAGFEVEDLLVREPYETEHPTRRGYVVARRS